MHTAASISRVPAKRLIEQRTTVQVSWYAPRTALRSVHNVFRTFSITTTLERVRIALFFTGPAPPCTHTCRAPQNYNAPLLLVVAAHASGQAPAAAPQRSVMNSRWSHSKDRASYQPARVFWKGSDASLRAGPPATSGLPQTSDISTVPH